MIRIIFVLFVIYLFPTSLFADEEIDELNEVDKLIEQYKEEAKEIFEHISDPENWKGTEYSVDKIKTKALQKYFDILSLLNVENIEDILIGHLEYRTYPAPVTSRLRIEHVRPVIFLLIEIGLKSVKPIVNAIKTYEEKVTYDSEGERLAFETTPLILIYESGGYGLQMARMRLTLESKILSGKEKELLEETLNNSYFSGKKQCRERTRDYYYNEENVKEYKETADNLLKKLSEKDLWDKANYKNDKSKTEKLLKYLELTTILRCEGIEKIIIEHLMYTPYETIPSDRVIDKDELYPVSVVLKKIGIVAVKPLIEVLKIADIEKSENKQEIELRRNIALECLIDIYEQGGFGKEMTKYRLQLEIENTKDEKQKQLLQKALENNILN